MNQPAINAYATVVPGVAGGPVVVPLVSATIGAPPLRGVIRNLRVVRTGTGTPGGTTVTVNIREAGSGRLRFSSTDPLPSTIDITALPSPNYSGALELEVLNDAGGAGDSYIVTTDIEGPL